MKIFGIMIFWSFGFPFLILSQQAPKQHSDSLRKRQIEIVRNDPDFKKYINSVNDYIQSNRNDDWHLSDPKINAKQLESIKSGKLVEFNRTLKDKNGVSKADKIILMQSTYGELYKKFVINQNFSISILREAIQPK